MLPSANGIDLCAQLRQRTYCPIIFISCLDQEETIRAGGIELDSRSHSVYRNGVGIELSPTEIQLLLHLMKNRGRVLEQEELFQSVWHHPSLGDLRTILVHISNLRKKIEDDPTQPRRIKTVRGIGYFLATLSSDEFKKGQKNTLYSTTGKECISTFIIMSILKKFVIRPHLY